jgi:hypothetical protein
MKNPIKLFITHISQKHGYAICPWHKSHVPGKANLEITLEGQYAGKYHCFSCGKSGQLSKELLEKLIRHRKISKKKIMKPIDWNYLDYKYCQSTDWLRTHKPFDVHEDTLFYLHCGWDGEAFTFPMRDFDETMFGIQRRFPDGLKCAVEGSQNGLFISILPPTSIPQPCMKVIGGILFICEGVSDTATMLDLGYHAIGRPNNNSRNELVEKWLYETNKLSGSSVYVVADNDVPGIDGAIKLTEFLGLNRDRVLVPPKHKDIREMKDKIGREETIGWITSQLK